MKKIGIVIPWFGKFRNDFSFWVKSVEYNPTVDFLLFTDQQIEIPLPNNLKVFKTSLCEIEKLARKTIWEGCVISKPYKLCDYKPAYGELFCEYLKSYDFWGHCDMDMYFGDIRKFLTDEILDKYDRIGNNGPFTLYSNRPDVNAIYHKVDDITSIFSDQRPFGFDEWGLNQNGASPYWMKNFPERLWNGVVYDNLVPYHYSFVSYSLKSNGLDVRNLMFSFDNGKLYAYGTLNGDVFSTERMYVHIQKRPIIVKTECTSRFSIIPSGKIIPYVENVTYSYLKWHIRDSKFWAYYVRLRNKINSLLNKAPYSNMILFPNDDYYKGVFEKPFYYKFLKLFRIYNC